MAFKIRQRLLARKYKRSSRQSNH